jgi:hypothetical protein
MKQIYLNTKRTLTMAAVAIVLSNTSLQAQTLPELVFTGGTKLNSSPAAGNDGAIYWFKNVGTGIDAFVKINGRSSSNVVLKILDETGTGYDNSFQPKIGFSGGANNTVTDWYMEFRISFVKSADTSLSVPVTTFNATALDVDGSSSGSGSNATYIHEAYSFYGLTSATVESNTTLTGSAIMSGSTQVGQRFEAGNTEYDGIDVNASKARVTTKYDNTSSFIVRIGGGAKGTVDVSSGRQYSLWFKGFTYLIPVPAPLPVDLISFAAKLHNKATVLDWTTSNEKDFSHFVIQRSTDGKSFDDAGMIFSDENSKAAVKGYTYTDKAAIQSTIVYYRLKMVDIDGKYKYSEIRLIRKANDQEQVSVLVYPNPVVTDLRITIPDSWQGKSVSYTIYSSNGNVIKQKINNQAGQTEVLNMTGTPAGIYMIKVVQGTETITKQIVKN